LLVARHSFSTLQAILALFCLRDKPVQ